MSERSPARIVTAYELSVRSPGEVYEWLSQRPQNARDAKRDWDEETEMSLLKRNDPLIELGLARYSTYHTILRNIFTSRQGRSEADTGVRLTLLRHGGASRLTLNEFPQSLFEGVDGEITMQSWLSTASENEISALFSNPALSNNFLLRFFEQKAVWMAMTEENRHVAIRAFADNPRCSTKSVSLRLKGYSEDEYNAVFTAAWKLAETVDTTNEWAKALDVLYSKMESGRVNIDNAVSSAKRWVNSDPDEGIAATKDGFMSSWQQLRKRLVAPEKTLSREQRDKYLKSDDIAIRAAAYEYSLFTPDEIKGLGENEKGLLITCLLDNPEIWRTKATRDALNFLCWGLISAAEDGDSDNVDGWDKLSDFHSHAETWSKSHPDWFEDEKNSEYDESGKLVNPDDKPVTAGIFTEKLSDLNSLITRHLDAVSQRLRKLDSTVRLIFYCVIGLIIYLVWRG